MSPSYRSFCSSRSRLIRMASRVLSRSAGCTLLFQPPMTWALHAGQRASPLPTNRQQMPATKKKGGDGTCQAAAASRNPFYRIATRLASGPRHSVEALSFIRQCDDGPPLPTALDSRGIGRLLCRALTTICWAGAPIGSLHGRSPPCRTRSGLRSEESGESRNGIGGRWGVVAGGRRVRSGRRSAARYSDGEHGSYSL
jgi:hypothetical protein